ncbi:MAG: hypothetical protein H6811_05140 [Phycisphaeraceae bacterium]|nr:hypothetical protein [Phycisphaeraceae bacterium]
MSLDHTGARFQTTNWSLVEGLRAEDPAARAAAADELARIYWPAVYAYLRRSGVRREAAQEATQAFFATVVLGRGLMERADPSKGSLRSLVRAAVKRFQIDEHRAQLSRAADRTFHLSAVEREESLLGAADGNPDAAFERRWALAHVDEAIRRCREHFEGKGMADHWRLFELRVLSPALGATQPPPLAEAAVQTGCRDAADGAQRIQTVKRRLEAFLGELLERAGEADTRPASLLGAL